MLYALILAGGKGTRLYPLSRTSNPKQFMKVINNKSFLRNTVDRIMPIISKENIYVVTNEEYHEKICSEIPGLNADKIIAEPYNKETATCIGLAAVKLLKKDKEAVMIVLPSDHYIENEKVFTETLTIAAELAEKKRGLITIGIQPTRAETGYGYIQMGERIICELPSYKVERFLEKPNSEVAKDLLMKGNYLWNSGIFVWRADVFLRELDKYMPKLYKSMLSIYQDLNTEEEAATISEQYKIIDGISVDFGIMQKTRRGYVIKSEFIWDDIGSFAALSRFLTNYKGNNVSGCTFLEDCENCSIFGGSKLIIGFGIKELVVVDAGDVILIMDKNKDNEIKHLITEIKEENELAHFL